MTQKYNTHFLENAPYNTLELNKWFSYNDNKL